MFGQTQDYVSLDQFVLFESGDTDLIEIEVDLRNVSERYEPRHRDSLREIRSISVLKSLSGESVHIERLKEHQCGCWGGALLSRRAVHAGVVTDPTYRYLPF